MTHDDIGKLFPEPPTHIALSLSERLTAAWREFTNKVKPNDEFRRQWENMVAQRMRAAFYRTMKINRLMELVEKGGELTESDAQEIVDAIEPLPLEDQVYAMKGATKFNRHFAGTTAWKVWIKQHRDEVVALNK